MPSLVLIPIDAAMVQSNDGASSMHVLKGHKHRETRLTPGGLGAYAKAGYSLSQGQTQFIGTIDPEHPFIVIPLMPTSSLDHHFGYHEDAHAFVTRKSGTYLAEFYLNIETLRNGYLTPAIDPETALSTQTPLGQVVVALRKIKEGKSTFLGLTQFTPVFCVFSTEQATTQSFGTHQELLELSEGDELQFVIKDLPGSPYNESQWFYSGSTTEETNEVAYLTLIRVD
jgi:hypothetical protein